MGTLGLPLDNIYPIEIQDMRDNKKHICEIGNMAVNSNENLGIRGLIQIMNYSYWFCIYFGYTDFVVGIHPEWTPLYERLFGLKEVPNTRKIYDKLNGVPVVLMAVSNEELFKINPMPRAIKTFLDNPIKKEEFDGRFSIKDLLK
jgi:hypothetical protein